VAAEEGKGEARRVELAEVVAPFLEHAHLEARRGQHPGRRRAAGPRAHHDYVLRHAQACSGRERIARGARSLRPRESSAFLTARATASASSASGSLTASGA